jgi:hypothetical protein
MFCAGKLNFLVTLCLASVGCIEAIAHVIILKEGLLEGWHS